MKELLIGGQRSGFFFTEGAELHQVLDWVNETLMNDILSESYSNTFDLRDLRYTIQATIEGDCIVISTDEDLLELTLVTITPIL